MRASSSTSEILPQTSRRDNPDRDRLLDLKEVPISGHEHDRLARDGLFKHRHIAGIPNLDPERRRPVDHSPVPTKERFYSLHRLWRHPQLPAQYTPQLVEHRLAYDQSVIGDDDPKHVRADAPGGHSTHQDVGVEEDPQETSRKTSSSVR